MAKTAPKTAQKWKFWGIFGRFWGEAEQLIHHADLDQDGALSREEILARWELFVGSRATDYGQDLHRGHDEL